MNLAIIIIVGQLGVHIVLILVKSTYLSITPRIAAYKWIFNRQLWMRKYYEYILFKRYPYTNLSQFSNDLPAIYIIII